MTLQTIHHETPRPPVPAPRRPMRFADFEEECRDPKILLRGSIRRGILVIASFALAFGGWGATAPIAGGAVAPARITPDGGLRTVQHLEGGIVARLHVREGDAVAEGTPLVTLESVDARVEVDRLNGRRQSLLAEQARLEAERGWAADLSVPNDLVLDDPGAQALMDAERRLFASRKEMIASRKDILSRRIDRLGEQIAGFEAQQKSTERQIDLAQEEVTDKNRLLAHGLVPKTDVLHLDRTIAGLEGARAEFLAEIGSTEQQVSETFLELMAIDIEHAMEINRRNAEIRLDIEEIDHTLEARGDILRRSVVTAPMSGRVMNLLVNTEGGVVGPGEPILDIVPVAETLTIEAMVSPSDIDLVEMGDAAVVTLTAYSGRDAPRLAGTVTSVSADTVRDERTGRDYYEARVEVPHEALDTLGITLMPGMQADVMIVAKARTLIGYLFEPFTQVLRRGLREN